MKVKDLLLILSASNPEAEVILQRDAEGNSYSPLSGADTETVYVPDSTWSGQVYALNSSASDYCMSEAEWEALKESPRCVTLAPVN